MAEADKNASSQKVDEFVASASDGINLEPPERQLLRAIYGGEAARLGKADEIRAVVLRSVCLHTDELPGGQAGRICVRGGKVVGVLDLIGLNLDFALRFEGTRFASIVLTDTRLLALEFTGGCADGFRADRLEVAHGFVMGDGFTSGSVYMPSSWIGGDLNCGGARLLAQAGPSLLIDGARIGGRVYLTKPPHARRRFHSNHGVYGRNARIAGGVLCTGGEFDSEVDFTRAQVQGEFSFSHALIRDEVVLANTHISAGLTLEKTQIDGPRVSLERARIDGRLRWNVRRSQRRAAEAPGSESTEPVLCVDLTQTHVGYLDDDLGTWHNAELLLDGFSLDGVSGPHDKNWLTRRKDWLRRQRKSKWSAHPYDQFRAALRDAGQESAAREIAIAREDARRHHGGLSAVGKGLNALYKVALGHGYQPWRFFVVSAVIVFAFWLLRFRSLDACRPSPRPETCGDFALPKVEAADYNSVLFSLDAFLPVDLKQTSAWSPAEPLDAYLVASEIGLGWLFTAVLIGAVTGVLRKD